MNVTEIDERIIKFIKKHHVLTLATSHNNEPYCANCFYAFMNDEKMFVFTSDYETKHVKDAIDNKSVAGSIVLETKIVGKIQGIQFTGNIFEPKDDLLRKAKYYYLKRFPFAILMQTTLWVVSIDFLKMTDNQLGFGKKMIWKNESV